MTDWPQNLTWDWGVLNGAAWVMPIPEVVQPGFWMQPGPR
jgi:hypothetical protein